ncbi:hypothetical protein HMPREF1000_04265 [Parabacteroides sp. D26]|nr:hypothetical protein HMPREF1000_04265 [Parabacteroides sp. D26]
MCIEGIGKFKKKKLSQSKGMFIKQRCKELLVVRVA